MDHDRLWNFLGRYYQTRKIDPTFNRRRLPWDHENSETVIVGTLHGWQNCPVCGRRVRKSTAYHVLTRSGWTTGCGCGNQTPGRGGARPTRGLPAARPTKPEPRQQPEPQHHEDDDVVITYYPHDRGSP